MKFNLFARLAVVFAAGLISISTYASSDGVWSESPAGLPYCRYDSGKDMSFLLGNYRMNVITHSNGIYQVLSGERVWAGFNVDPARADYGRNQAIISKGRKEFELIGPAAKSMGIQPEVYTGIGFTRYDYLLMEDIKCSRMISVLPSEKINEGYPCFLITVTLSNIGKGSKTISYEEIFSPMYLPVADQNVPVADRMFHYPMTTDISFRCLKAYFTPEPQKFIQRPSLMERYRYEVASQSVFLYSPDAFLCISDTGEFKAQYFDLKLKKGEKVVLNIVVGFSAEDDAKELAESMLSQAKDGQFGAFETQWKDKLPKIYDKNRTVRREMLMNAHSLEASAVYDGYFKETFVPAESGAALRTGENLSNCDHLQRALPLCYSNPELAKSVLKYVMKHACYDGRIFGGNTGYGHVASSYMSGCYDLQAHLLHTLSEYLRITGDYGFLDEVITIYSGDHLKVMTLAERCFVYLRDEVPGEADHVSHLRNLSLASSFMPEFAEILKKSGRTSNEFVKAVEEYAAWAWETFRKSEGYLSEEHDSNVRSMDLYHYFRAQAR